MEGFHLYVLLDLGITKPRHIILVVSLETSLPSGLTVRRPNEVQCVLYLRVWTERLSSVWYV